MQGRKRGIKEREKRGGKDMKEEKRKLNIMAEGSVHKGGKRI